MPVPLPPPTADPPASAGVDPNGSRRRSRVWVVDDDQTTLLLAQEVLVQAGFDAEIFDDALQAIQVAAVTPPDIIVLDVMMPALDGYQFCNLLRSVPTCRDVPVLVATSLDDIDSINRAYEAGATDFATKPLNWPIEIHRLRYLLRAAETARQLKQKEGEARRAKEDWEQTFNSLSDVVTLLDDNYRVLRANSAAARALQRPIDQLIGQHCYRLFQNASEPCPGCPVTEAFRKQEPASLEKRYQNTGTDCLITATPVVESGRAQPQVVHIAHDLTEHKLLEAQYRQAQKMEALGTLAGGVAHDFNNLLLVISSYAELLRSDLKTNPEHTEFTGTIIEAVQRGAELSRQLLTFSRKGVIRSEKRPVRVDEVVRSIQKMLKRILPKNITLQTQSTPELAEVEASADQLHQVLMNLSVNASHAMPAGGTITFDTRDVHLDADYCRLHPEVQPGPYVQLTVTDTGHGMSPEVQQRIFEPFFTTKKVGEGTGLGLSVVYGVIRDHGGQIHCYSEVGTGTSFKIYLPALRRRKETGLVAAREALRQSTGTETILVVDDEAHIRNMVRNCLARLGYTVLLGRDGQHGLELFLEQRANIRLVMLDLGMPGMSGWECLAALRRLDPKLPVIIATGYGADDLLERAQREGAAGFLAKPYTIDVLGRSVREVLDGKRWEAGSNP